MPADSAGVEFAMVAGAAASYIFPSMVAFLRGHRRLTPILILNVALGWTVLIWFVCLAWAFVPRADQERRPRRKERGREHEIEHSIW